MTITDLHADLDSHHIEGIAIQGDMPFSVPLVSHIAGNLWTGGCIDGIRLPDDFRYVVSLYPSERYTLGPDTERVELQLEDSSHDLGAGKMIYQVAGWALAASRDGKTLVHCQAGLNRSALVAGLAMILSGVPAGRAIRWLRDRRSPAVLCNQTFVEWLADQDRPSLLHRP